MYNIRNYDADDYEGLTNLIKNSNYLGWNVEIPSVKYDSVKE